MSATTLPQPLLNALRACGGYPLPDPNAPCHPCRRSELLLMAVLPSVVDSSHAMTLTAAGHAWPPSFDLAFGTLPRQATTPVAQLARPGHIYLYYPAWEVWDLWQVMSNGLTRKLLHQVSPEQYSRYDSDLRNAGEARLCSRSAANVPAHFISVHGAEIHEKIWLAFSSTLWTAATLKRYAANPDVQLASYGGRPGPRGKLRDLRGRELSPSSILKGQFPTAGCLPLNEASLQHNVIDFCAGTAPAGRWPTPALGRAFQGLPHRPQTDRFGMATTFAQQVRDLERTLAPPARPKLYENTTLLVMLPDPQGVIDTHNQLRLQVMQAHQGWLAGDADATGLNADPQRPWKVQSVLHAGYIQAWVTAQEKTIHQQRLDRGVYRSHQIIYAAEYQQIQAQEKRTGVPFYPPGTIYQKLPHKVPESYRVIFPKSFINKSIDELAVDGSKRRLERYRSHLDQGAINVFNTQHKTQEEGWAKQIEAHDADYVHWLESPPAQAMLRYDFDDALAWQQGERSAEALRRDVAEAQAQRQVLASCYGGGACSVHSLKHLIELFGKDEADPDNFIARAMLKEVGYDAVASKLSNPDEGTRSDLYGAYQASRAAWEEFSAAWQHRLEQTRVADALLLQTAYQVTHKMREIALLPNAPGAHGLKLALADATRKQVLWVRAAGLAHFLQTGQRQYLVGVKWRAGAFSEALTELSLPTTAVEAAKRSQAGATGKQARTAAKAAQAELRPLLAKNTANMETTVMLVVDEKHLARIAAARGEKMLEVVSAGPFGQPQPNMRVPESLAREIVRDYQPINRLQAMKSGAFMLNMGALVLSWYALAKSWEDLQKQGGTEQVETALSGLGSIVGIVGVGVEAGALLLTPVAKATQGTPAAALLARVPWYLWLQFAAGITLAAGAGVNAAVAYVKAKNKDLLGDEDAARAYYATTGLQLGGFFSLAAGAYYAHRARVLTLYGQEAVVRLFSRTFTPVQLGRSFLGGGLMLFVGGIALSFYALYLEDDDNELFLRRSFFGKGHPQLGKFESLEHEVQNLGALALGTRAELEWLDHFTGADEVTARVKVFKPEPAAVATAVLEGFSAINGKKLYDLHNGELPALAPSPDAIEATNGVCTAELTFKVPVGVQAVRLTYAFFKDRTPRTPPASRGEIWLAD